MSFTYRALHSMMMRTSYLEHEIFFASPFPFLPESGEINFRCSRLGQPRHLTRCHSFAAHSIRFIASFVNDSDFCAVLCRLAEHSYICSHAIPPHIFIPNTHMKVATRRPSSREQIKIGFVSGIVSIDSTMSCGASLVIDAVRSMDNQIETFYSP